MTTLETRTLPIVRPGFRSGPGALGLAFRRGRLRPQRQQTLRAGR